MRFLLDTHVVIWLGLDSDRVPDRIKEVLSTNESELYVSSISAWEISVKHAREKLPLPFTPERFTRIILKDFDAKSLDFEIDHAFAVAHLPWYHRDPFDRMLISQAQTEGLVLVTSDQAIRQYDVATLW